MKGFIIISGIILILLMILMVFDKNSSLKEAFGTLPIVTQSSFLPSDIPGATSTNPTIAKPTNKEIIDAKDTVYQFLDLCKNVKTSVTERQANINLKNSTPIFLNELSALQNNPDIVKSEDFYNKWRSYQSAIQSLKQRPLLEGFATSSSIKQDVANLLDAISIFEEEYARVDTSKITYTNDKNFVNDLHAQAARDSVNMRKSSLPTDAAFAGRVQMLTSDYQRGFSILSTLPAKVTQSTQPSSGTASSDKMTLEGLKSLIQNIQAEQLRLQNLRSSDSTTIARIGTLESLLTDLRGFVGKVERKEITIESVPIKASDAQNFLAQFKSADTLPYLMEPSGTTDTSLDTGSANIFNAPHSQKAGDEVTQLTGTLATGSPVDMIPAEAMKYLKNLEWTIDIKLHNNPEIAQKDRIMERIKELEQRIAAYAYNDVPIPPALQDAFKQELQYLTGTLQQYYEPSYSADENRLPVDHTRITEDTRNGSNSYDSTYDAYSMNSYNPYMNTDTTNTDAMIRPGFIMTDETIKHRGSASAFDESTVGGLDYKQRAKDLCRQIKSAQLGDPESFGCIENQEAVSGSYSWKGNVEMVCNRLGDTWGSWYPEMFGCPKYDSTARYKGSQFKA